MRCLFNNQSTNSRPRTKSSGFFILRMDLANGRRNASPTRKSHKPCRGGVSPPEKERVDGDNKSACHPELVELPRVERSEQAEARCVAPQGSLNEFGWLSTENVTSHQKATEILNEIPLKHEVFSASHLVLRSVKVRLRALHSAQNDIQWHYVVVFFQNGEE